MRLAALVVAGALAISGPGCRPRGTAASDDPAATALRLFAAARHTAALESEGAALFDLEAGARGRARLLDAMAQLADVAEPRAVATTPMEDGGRAVVDVTADLPAGGKASYGVELRRAADGSWRVSAFWGPGVAWPDRAGSPAEGLSVSPPPR